VQVFVDAALVCSYEHRFRLPLLAERASERRMFVRVENRSMQHQVIVHQAWWES
jgi:hypothetical protein